MENVTLNAIYDKLNRLEKLVYKVDQKVEHFIGFETVSKKEANKLKSISKDMKSRYKHISEVAKEMGVDL